MGTPWTWNRVMENQPIRIQLGKILWEILVGKSCRKFLWEILAGNSCGKFLQEILAGNAAGHAVGNLVGNLVEKVLMVCNGSKNGKKSPT